MKLKIEKGFTLLELLVVIAIIGLMASITMVVLNSARQKSRDAKRKSDIALIRKALELYYNTNNSYPNGGTDIPSANTAYDIQLLSSFLIPSVASSLPNDPKLNTGANYQYIWRLSGQSYGLLVPFSNDGGTDCKFINGDGDSNWFSSAPECSYQE